MKKNLLESEDIDIEEFTDIVTKALMNTPGIDQDTKAVVQNNITSEIIYETKQGARFQVQITRLT